MANIKNFKLLRNQTALTSKAAAVSALEALSLPNEEGTLVLARYTENSTAGSVLGIVNIDGSVSVIDVSGNIQTAISELAKAANAENGKVVTTVSETDGVVSETKANVKDLQLGGYVKDTTATGAISGTDTINAALSKLENTVAANEVASSDESITVTDSASGTDIIVNVDGKTIVKDATSKALKTDVQVVYVAAVPASGEDPATPATIQLQDNTGATLSSISVSDIVGNGMLSSSSYDETTGVLTLVFNNADGSTREVEVDLTKLLDIDDIVIANNSTDYLSFDVASPAAETGQASLGVKLATVTYTAGTASTDPNLAVDETNGSLLDASETIGAVKNYVDEVTGNSEITEASVNNVAATISDGTNGGKKIEVTIDGGDIALTDYTPITPLTTDAQEVVEIEATDTVNDAIAKIEKAVNVNETVVAAALNDLNSTKVDVISVNGVASKEAAVDDVVASVTIDGGDIALTGYTKPGSSSAIAATDTVNDAIGKLEKGLETAVAGGVNSVTGEGAIAVDSTDTNNPVVSLTVAASNGSDVSGSALTNPISINNNDELTFAESLDAGYYAVE